MKVQGASSREGFQQSFGTWILLGSLRDAREVPGGCCWCSNGTTSNLPTGFRVWILPPLSDSSIRNPKLTKSTTRNPKHPKSSIRNPKFPKPLTLNPKPKFPKPQTLLPNSFVRSVEDPSRPWRKLIVAGALEGLHGSLI